MDVGTRLPVREWGPAGSEGSGATIGSPLLRGPVGLIRA